MSELEAGGGPSLVGDFEGGAATVPGAVVAGENESLTAGVLGVCAAGLDQFVSLGVQFRRRDPWFDHISQLLQDERMAMTAFAQDGDIFLGLQGDLQTVVWREAASPFCRRAAEQCGMTNGLGDFRLKPGQQTCMAKPNLQ